MSFSTKGGITHVRLTRIERELTGEQMALVEAMRECNLLRQYRALFTWRHSTGAL